METKTMIEQRIVAVILVFAMIVSTGFGFGLATRLAAHASQTAYDITFDAVYLTAEQQAFVANKITEIVNGFGFTSDTSDFEKFETIRHCVASYKSLHLPDPGNNDLQYTTYGMLSGTLDATCAGNAGLFYKLAVASGLECDLWGAGMDIFPDTDFAEHSRHELALVKIDGKWYYFDPTGCGGEYRIDYTLFRSMICYWEGDEGDEYNGMVSTIFYPDKYTRSGKLFTDYVIPDTPYIPCEHEWVAGKVLKYATGVTAGEQQYTCSKCAAEKTAAIPATGDNPFDDVFTNDYYYDAVNWAYTNNITLGTGGAKYSPNIECTRAQIVTFLWRAAGMPSASATSPFKDVKAGDWYYDAVMWAVEKGITNGVGGGNFAPDTVCTRAQIVTFIHRSQGCPAPTVTTSFNDVQPGTWYYEATSWAVENNITNGVGGNMFAPDANCNRAQAVTFLHRLFEPSK